jgi:hypothetical protein
VYLSSGTVRSYWSELEKIAATKQIKVLRSLVRRGRLDEARALAERLADAGVLKVTKQGTNVGRLKPGAEAVTDIVVGAKKHPGLAVRKPSHSAPSPLQQVITRCLR